MSTLVILQNNDELTSQTFDLAPEKIIEVLNAYVKENKTTMSDDDIEKRIKTLRPTFYELAKEKGIINDDFIGAVRMTATETEDSIDNVIGVMIPSEECDPAILIKSALFTTMAIRIYRSRK